MPSSSGVHMKTYTAGEDDSRLQRMAKELGLQNQRQPRPQVRARTPTLRVEHMLQQIVRDSTFEDARMRAIYSSHTILEDPENDLLGGRSLWSRMMRNASMDDRTKQTTTTTATTTSDMPDSALVPLESTEQLPEGDPHAAGLGGSLASAILGIIKGMVGPAILFLPHGFAGAGWAMAIPIMFGATFMYLYSSRCLLEVWKQESTRSYSASTSTGEMTSLLNGGGNYMTTKRVILSYPELSYRALGSTGETIVKTGIALMQSGVCLTYLIFVPQNLHSSMYTLTGSTVSPEGWLIVMILIQIPLSWIRDIRKLTLTNFMANTLILYGLMLCLGFAFKEAGTDDTMGPLESIGRRLTSLDPYKSNWFLFIGTSILLFEGSITLLVPLQEAILDERERREFPKVYIKVIWSIIIFYAFFGVTNWMAYGDQVRTVLTTSLPDTILVTTVQLAYSLAVIFTFPLQNFPALEIACHSIGNLFPTSTARSHVIPCCGTVTASSLKRNIISSVLVLLLALVAVGTMDSLDKVVSLMGALLGCPIAFIFPPLIHTSLMDELSATRKWGNYFVVIFGFISMILASTTTILAWNK